MDWKPRNEYCPAIVVSKLFLSLTSSPAFCAFARPVKKFVAEFVQSLLGKQKQNEKHLYCKVELRWMSFSLVVKASDCQCRCRNSPGFDPSILLEPEGRQMKPCSIQYIEKKIKKIPPFKVELSQKEICKRKCWVR